MSYIIGLKEYIDNYYGNSIFSEAFDNGQQYCLYLYGQLILQGMVTRNGQYDLDLELANGDQQTIEKTDIKFLHHASDEVKVRKKIKIDKKIANKQYSPIIGCKDRHHIKNKTLFPLMDERQVMIISILEGEYLKGLISGFSRYEITLNLQGGIPVTICRHAILNVTDKKKRCYLKSFQQKSKDWQKSHLFVATN